MEELPRLACKFRTGKTDASQARNQQYQQKSNFLTFKLNQKSPRALNVNKDSLSLFMFATMRTLKAGTGLANQRC